MVVAKKQRRVAGPSGDPRMSPAAARETMPADKVQVEMIDALLKQRVVPDKVFARVMQLHFDGMTMAKAQEVIDHLDTLPYQKVGPFP